MRLDSIHLQNYRAHKDLHVQLKERFNVVVGVNGSGKTSLLKGLCDSLTGLFRGNYAFSSIGPFQEDAYSHTETIERNGRYRFEPRYPVSIRATGRAFDGDFDWTISKVSEIASADMGGRPPSAALKDIRKQAPTEGDVEQVLPVVAFYRANRQWAAARSEPLQAATQKSSRFDGYTQWHDAAVSVAGLQTWVISKCLERFQHSSETGKLFSEIVDDELALVNAALSQAIDNIRGLRYDMQQKSLLADWTQSDGNTLTISFDNLSDGQRAVICLVTDIARRICLLNPQLGMDVISKTPGVVLIDELDMHLHPKWQRLITNGLKAAFPEVQFVVTSHSPQVLGELQPEEIILLRDGATSQPQVSYGLDSSQVLEEIMGASSRNIRVEEKLAQMFLEIEKGHLDIAKELLQELEILAPDIPELGGAEALIRRKEIIGR